MCISCCVPAAETSRGSLLGRRSLLLGATAIATSLSISACGEGSAGTTSSSSLLSAAAPDFDNTKLGLILLGTAAGPPVVGDRNGISSALVVDGKVYVVDCGRSAVTQFRHAGLKFGSLEAIFITHLHNDHTADYYNFFILGGRPISGVDNGITAPIPVYGPGSAGGLPPAFGDKSVPLINPENPTPGLSDLTRACNAAFAYSNNSYMRSDSGYPDYSAIPEVHELSLPSVGATFENTAPPCPPFQVMSDDRVRVTATLVPHGPAFPSFAYRFDTEYGSVVFSGDTAHSPNLIGLANNADMLVHEAINLEGSNLPPASQSHMLNSHVLVQDVGKIAADAGVRSLVLSHISDFHQPVIDEERWQSWASRWHDPREVSRKL